MPSCGWTFNPCSPKLTWSCNISKVAKTYEQPGSLHSNSDCVSSDSSPGAFMRLGATGKKQRSSTSFTVIRPGH